MVNTDGLGPIRSLKDSCYWPAVDLLQKSVHTLALYAGRRQQAWIWYRRRACCKHFHQGSYINQY